MITTLKQLVTEAILLNEWFPQKEELYFFEQLQQKQEQIYNDSADYGILSNDKLKNDIKTNLKKLTDFYGFKKSSGSWGGQISYAKVELFVPFEKEYNQIRGVVLSVTLNTDPRLTKRYNKNTNEYWVIDINNQFLTLAQAKQQYKFKPNNY